MSASIHFSVMNVFVSFFPFIAQIGLYPLGQVFSHFLISFFSWVAFEISISAWDFSFNCNAGFTVEDTVGVDCVDFLAKYCCNSSTVGLFWRFSCVGSFWTSSLSWSFVSSSKKIVLNNYSRKNSHFTKPKKIKKITILKKNREIY